jgi:hypothetical protein
MGKKGMETGLTMTGRVAEGMIGITAGPRIRSGSMISSMGIREREMMIDRGRGKKMSLQPILSPDLERETGQKCFSTRKSLKWIPLV